MATTTFSLHEIFVVLFLGGWGGGGAWMKLCMDQFCTLARHVILKST